MDFLIDNPNAIWRFRDVVLSNVDIVKTMEECGLKLERKDAGNFDFRGFCPFHKGKGGGVERTPSFFVSSSTSSFCCFGCSKSGNVIDFLSYIHGSPPDMVLEKLAKKIGVIDDDGNYDELQFGKIDEEYSFESVKTIEPFLFEMSAIIRNYIKMFVGTEDFDDELIWVEKIAAKIDSFLLKIGHEDWEYASELCDKVHKKIKDRIKKRNL